MLRVALEAFDRLAAVPGNALNQAAILRPGRCYQPWIKLGGVHGSNLPFLSTAGGPVGHQQRNGAVARAQVGNACLVAKRAALIMPEPCYLAIINAGKVFRQGGQRTGRPIGAPVAGVVIAVGVSHASSPFFRYKKAWPGVRAMLVVRLLCQRCIRSSGCSGSTGGDHRGW